MKNKGDLYKAAYHIQRFVKANKGYDELYIMYMGMMGVIQKEELYSDFVEHEISWGSKVALKDVRKHLKEFKSRNSC